MNQEIKQALFLLLRSAINGNFLSDEEKALLTQDKLPSLFFIANKHDIAHILASPLSVNGLLTKGEEYSEKFTQKMIAAVYRYEQMNYEYKKLCDELERAKIPFMPLKGSVIRKYYPEPWMRTSCDIDVLVHKNDLDRTLSHLVQKLNYKEPCRSTHDVSLMTHSGVHIELHFDLVEEGRANNAIETLKTVWDNAVLRDNYSFWYEMTDEYFYFYHIAHMAKHFYEGGCGIRPFLDLFILDTIEGIDIGIRDDLLIRGNLFDFASSSRKLSKVWFGQDVHDDLTAKMQNFILIGGVYGSSQNRVALQQTKKGGKFGYIFSRIFISYNKLKRYYPILEKHRWLMPIMQIRRWGMLLDPSVVRMAKAELSANKNMEKSTADDMNTFLQDVGL